MSPPYIIHKTAQDLAAAVAGDLAAAIRRAALMEQPLFIALSGGSTPGAMFRHLATPAIAKDIPWKWVHFFWGDERCVPPDHPDSNYGTARQILFEDIDIPPENIHRIRGEASPVKEAFRYAREILSLLPQNPAGRPVFHRIFLGMGEDGHTASLFPAAPALSVDDKICAIALHPVTQQKRITLTLPVINSAREVTFLVSGASKAARVAQIFQRAPGYQELPAAKVHPAGGRLIWQLDEAAAHI